MSKQHPGPAIRAARRAIELEQRVLAECIGRSSGYVCNFEKGRIAAKPEEILAMWAAIRAAPNRAPKAK
jgi:DNA-binding transcriptional regulator YiaG